MRCMRNKKALDFSPERVLCVLARVLASMCQMGLVTPRNAINGLLCSKEHYPTALPRAYCDTAAHRHVAELQAFLIR